MNIAETTETLMDMYIKIKDAPQGNTKEEEALQTAIHTLITITALVRCIEPLKDIYEELK